MTMLVLSIVLFASSGMCMVGNRTRGHWPKPFDTSLSFAARTGMNADRRRPYEVLYYAIDVFSILFESCYYRFCPYLKTAFTVRAFLFWTGRL